MTVECRARLRVSSEASTGSGVSSEDANLSDDTGEHDFVAQSIRPSSPHVASGGLVEKYSCQRLEPVAAPSAALPSIQLGSQEPLNDDPLSKPATGVGCCALALLTVLCGCGSQAPYEVLNSRDKGCAHLVVFTEHVFTAIGSLGALRSPRRLPWCLHFGLAALDAGYVILLSAAFSTSLPTAAVITLRNGNLVVSMFLDVWVLHRPHSWRQFAAVACITVGLAVISWYSSQANTRHQGDVDWSALIGLVCMLGALVSRALGSVVQELYCGKYNAPVVELLLYRSLLGLPLLATQWRAIARHAVRWSTEHDIAGLPGPAFWLLQSLNVAFDFGTKLFITKLISRTSALAATLVLTLQRFISFVLSAFFLGADSVGWELWFGTIAVLAGSLSYVASPVQPKKEKVR